jgi:hypothetical protein
VQQKTQEELAKEAEVQRVAKAKVRCLDKLIGRADFEELNDDAGREVLKEYQRNLIMSFKDWIDVKGLNLTEKQLFRVNEAWQAATDFFDDEHTDYGSYLA